MNLEGKKVLLSRCNIIKTWHDKEWWYTGFYDSTLKIYFNFFFVSVNLIDQFSFTLFDPKISKPLQFTKKLYLEKVQTKNGLSLNYHSGDLDIEYNSKKPGKWEFKFKNRDFHIELEINSTIPYFTKSNNEFCYNYTLLHYFNNTGSGFIKTPSTEYNINNALGYYDHCFGTIPSKTGWHWIAVQNSDVSLASLLNHGAYAQKYTQIYFNRNDEGFGLNRWIRLDEDVSFECYDLSNKFTSEWKVTSPDMDLTVLPLMYTCSKEKIPPIIPFLINVTHCEYFIKAYGKVRIDGHWITIKDLYGGMEEHYGKW